MIRACLTALLSHWRRNPIQLFTFIMGLAMATSLWSGVQAINAEARASYAAAADTLGEGQFDRLVPRNGSSLAVADYVALRRSGWLVSPMLEGRVGSVRVVGIDALTAPTGFGASAAVADIPIDTGADKPRLVANARTADVLGDVADVIVDDSFAPELAVGDIADVQALLGRSDLTQLVILPDQPMRQPPLDSLLPHLQRMASSQSADIAQLTDSFHLNLTAFGLLSFVVGLFIVHSAIGLAFEQRRAMIRTLRSLGVPLSTLIALILTEMFLLALIGAGLGILIGYAIAALLLPGVAATLQGLYGADVSGSLQFRAEWWLSGLALALAGTVLALAAGIWKIARMPLLASARPRAWAIASAARLRGQAIVAALLIASAILLAANATGLVQGFALLGCLLLGVALAFPVLADRVLSVIERRTASPAWEWFWADTRQQLPGLSLALMALLLAVSANIGVATMVSSFRLTFVGFLDQRLAPELYVQVDSDRQSAELAGFLSEQNLETLPLRSTDATILGRPVRLFGIEVGPTYRDNWVFLGQTATVWDEVAAGKAVILNEQFARRADLWVGDMVPITADFALPVGAVVGDYGNPNAQVSMSAAAFATLYPDIFAHQFGIRTPRPDVLREQIAAGTSVSPNAMIDQARLKAMSLDVFDRTFLVTGALNILTLAVASFAILMSLLTLADLRIPQLAPVWALGFTRKHLGRLELLRALALACLVFICAIPVGLTLAWVLLSVVNVAAFGWKLPIFFFPAEYALLGVYCLIAALIAAAWPVWRLIRTPPAALLKVFSNER